ncbi:hypothetical protein [Rhodohalobacter sp.]|uniref:hypothetical protein n=1 Tax=Rhodohalobacter sp. TaxID=1974210 RepID=UPI002ACD91B6|nr:hypothetical protein [Rhodohalobacter sp.]MDZ7758511.1 hypothetical protein [Rhodohalobacter sp.]
MKISITETDQSRISDVDFDNLQFGRVFSDHMLEMAYRDGKWHQPEIKPYGPNSIHSFYAGSCITDRPFLKE